MADDSKFDMPFLEHLEELRWRLFKSLISIVIFSIASWFFVDYVIDELADFVGEVYFMAPTEAFMVRIKISVIMGIVISVPVIFYQLWKFISPGLYKHEKSYVVPVVVASTLFFAVGGSFCYYVVLPNALRFLMGYGTDLMTPLISISNLLTFCAYLILAFGLVFELPVVAFFLGRIGLVDSRKLAKGRRYAVVAALIVGASLTPPDVFSQIMLAAPVIILYELSIWIVKFTGRERKKDSDFEEDERDVGLFG